MRYLKPISLVFLLGTLGLAACDSTGDGESGLGKVEGVWQFDDTDGNAYMVIEETDFTTFSYTNSEECYNRDTHEIRQTGSSRYEVVIRVIVHPGQDDAQGQEITQEYQYRAGSDRLVLLDGSGNPALTAHRADVEASSLTPLCSSDL